MFSLNLALLTNTFYDDVIPSQVLWNELQLGVEETTHAHEKETTGQNLWNKETKSLKDNHSRSKKIPFFSILSVLIVMKISLHYA